VKKYFIATRVGILLSGGLGLALYLYNKPHSDVSAIKPAFSFNAGDLYGEYRADETAANKKLVDKVIEVRGMVSDLRQTDSTADIQLETGDPEGTISCGFLLTGHKQMSLPAKGSSVTIKGRCTGFLADVNLVDCVIE
jgi:hypothetical protein